MEVGPDYQCSKCKIVVGGGMDGFKRHMKTPDHMPPYICGHGDCSHDYIHLSSLYAHLRQRHGDFVHQEIPAAADIPILEPLMEVDNVDDNNSEDDGAIADNGGDTDTHCEVPVSKSVSLSRSAERAVLNLRSGAYMTGSALQLVQQESFTLMQDTSDYLQNIVSEYLDKPEPTPLEKENLMKSFTLTDPFKHLKTKVQQMKVFKEKYGLLQPQEMFLGFGFDSRQHPKRPCLEQRQIPKSFQYVSIKDLLRSVLSDPSLREMILKEQPSSDEYMRSFKDGSLYEKLPENLKGAIRILLYVDDLEITQALSAAAGDYKIAGIYFGIQNLPPEINSLLTSVFVTALAFADDAKTERVWEPFLNDMRDLETEGIDIIIDGETVNFKAVLIAQIGDSLAACELLGFKKSSANKFCRWCYIDRQEMWEDGCKLGEPRTPEKHADDVEAAAVSEDNRTASGVNGPSLLNGLTFFNPIGHSVFDIFHDLLQGVNKMELKLALREYVCVKKYFPLEELKSRVKFFDYGFVDKYDRPRDNFTVPYLKKLDGYNLHLTGVQVWCFTRAFPFLFGDLVPDNDPFMKLISLLNQIMTIVFSRAISESDITELEQLIREHHNLFQEIYPEIIRKFGPLVLYWCVRYEARHLFFKVIATISHNYKNVLKTLMEVFQLKVAADKQQDRRQLIMGKRGTKFDTVDNFPHCQLFIDFGLNTSSSLYSVQHVMFHVTALQKPGVHPKFTQIHAIYVSENQENVYLVTRDWNTVRFEAKYCAFEVQEQDTAYTIRTPASFPSYRLLAIWKRSGPFSHKKCQ
ncbi:hypothetical protein FOCC_FOCC005298 [Frankliniella occidentalis]|nr:hypothetical protein FOCC_FOCC005298 [Frankliniella occidentalis]